SPYTTLFRSKEVRHGDARGCPAQARRLYPKGVCNCAQNAGFIVGVVVVGRITGHGLVAHFADRTNHDGFDLAAAALADRCSATVRTARTFIESDDQQTVSSRLKIAARQERAEFGL